MNTSPLIQNQLLITKFFVPVSSGSLISRPHLTSVLDESRKYPLTLVSAAAGFGKTTLLTSWVQSLQAQGPRVAWVSLDEEDNEPRLFWAYVLTALNKQQPERFSSLLTLLQSPHSPPLNTLLAELINLLVEGTETFLLILDDYHVITEQRVHTSLTYLIEHLPAQLRIIMATRADPPLPLARLRAQKQVLEVRTDQLRCTVEETNALFQKIINVQIPDETIQEITARMEGWLVGLYLLGLSLPERADPLSLLEQVSGDQSYILDYLTEEVLRRQAQEMQIFLLSTCILERLTASLCDAVMQQHGSQQMLERLERANLFVVSLDSKRQWYRYHALFAEALRYQLEQTHSDLVPVLHSRASLWHAEHNASTEAILHAFSAHQWEQVADLIAYKYLPLMSLTWGAGEHALVRLRSWLEQLPVEVVGSRPDLCLACAELVSPVISHAKLEAWFDMAEAMLTASLKRQTDEDASHPQLRLRQQNQLGGVITFRAIVRSYREDGQTALSLCEQALALISTENLIIRIFVGWVQLRAYYGSAVNDAVTAIERGLQTSLLAQKAGQTSLTMVVIGSTALYMIGTGQLHEAHQLTQKATKLAMQPEGFMLTDVGFPTLVQADILREWNQLDAALELTEEAISLCSKQSSPGWLIFSLLGYTILLRVCLSRGEREAARSALQQLEHISITMSQPLFLHYHSLFTTIDQVKLWLAYGELERATNWGEELDLKVRQGTPFTHEREEVACTRILLARMRPAVALERLEPALKRATTGQRWGHVIEMRLLQALAHQMCQQERQALDALAEAIHLAEPEGYIRSFVDEGAAMESLLYQLRRQNRKHGPTPYLDTLLAAFQQETKTHAQPEEPAQAYQLPEPLSQREREVLQLLVSGVSNQEIAQELVITVDTVKRHTSHIFSKLGVHNRMQAMLQARELGLLDEEV